MDRDQAGVGDWGEATDGTVREKVRDAREMAGGWRWTAVGRREWGGKKSGAAWVRGNGGESAAGLRLGDAEGGEADEVAHREARR